MPSITPVPSITYWSRLEPRPRAPSITPTLAAPIRDPLWMLTRQWQLGEFLGEDAASPTYVELATRKGPFDHWREEGGTTWRAMSDLPIEVLAEPEPFDIGDATHLGDLSLRLELGQTLEMLLREHDLGHTIDAFRSAFGLSATPPPGDDATSTLFALSAGRAIDGGQLYQAFVLDPSQLPDGLSIAEADQAAVLERLTKFKTWVEYVFQPLDHADPVAWRADRLDYRIETSAVASSGTQALLTAAPDRNGEFEWYTFDVTSVLGTGTPHDVTTTTYFPGNVRFRGMPNARWWDFEPASTDYGSVEPDRRDLARMVVVDFMLLHANDWFMVPFELAPGSTCHVESLVVHDVFGGATLIDRADNAQPPAVPPWTMFSTEISVGTFTGIADFTILPATPGSALQTGEVLEEVRFLRDETANLAWAVEHTVQNGLGEPWSGHERDREIAARTLLVSVSNESTVAAPIAYDIQTSVPRNWIPLVPVVTDANGQIALCEGEILDEDGQKVASVGRLLNPVPPGPHGYEIREEEIPRSGVLAQRVVHRTRWTDGKAYLWIARQRSAGAGEGSSGLRFDVAEPTTQVGSTTGPTLAEFDFTTLPPGKASLASYGLVFTRSSAATVQTGASTMVVDGIDQDVPRVGSDGVHSGLVLEEARTNLVADARAVDAASWSAASTGADTTQDFVAGPDGVQSADRSVVPSGGTGRAFVSAAVSGAYTASLWLRHATATVDTTSQWTLGATGDAPQVVTLNSAWQRASAVVSPSAATPLKLLPADGRDESAAGGLAADARDHVSDFHQLEAGAFATEAIVTSGGSATRADEWLQHPVGASLVDNGRLSLEFALQPKGGRAQYATTMRLWDFGTAVGQDYHAEIDPQLGLVQVKLGSAFNASCPIDWNALDTLELFIAVGGNEPTEIQWRVNGGPAKVAPIFFGTPFGPVVVPGRMDLLCSGGSRQFSSYVRRIAAWRRGKRPAWATGDVLADMDFTTLAPGAAPLLSNGLGFALIANGLGFARASAATVQTGASTVLTSGLGTDVARIGSDGVHGGLVLEEARTNLVTGSRDPVGGTGWTPSGLTTDAANFAAGPDGTATADRVTAPDNTYGPYFVVLGSIAQGTSYTYSQWVRTPSGTGPAQATFALGTSPQVPVCAPVATTSWQRLAGTAQASSSGSGASNASLIPVTGGDLRAAGGLARGALDTIVDAVQLEAGAFATEAIVTTTTTATRAGERLWHPAGASLVDNGRLSLALALQPKGGRAQYAAAVRLWTVDAGNYAEINPATGVVTVSIGGKTNQTSTATPVTWGALDTLELFVAAGGSAATEVQWRVNGGATRVAKVVASAPLGALAVPSTLDLFCNGTAQQLTAYVRGVTAWRKGRYPDWVQRGASDYLADLDFTALTPGPVTLAGYGLGFARASVATVQTDGVTVTANGIGPDVPRAGNDGVRAGLVFEEARTNLVADARALDAASWTANGNGGLTPDYAAGPDGLVAADRSEVPQNWFSNYLQPALAVGGTYTASAWLRQGAAPSSYYFRFRLGTDDTDLVATGDAWLSWQRVALSGTVPAASDTIYRYVPSHGGGIGGYDGEAVDVVSDLHQVEAGAFATEAIVTSGGSATRAGERLWHPCVAALVDGGRLSLELALQPKGGRAQYAAPVRLWSIDASNYAEIDPATGALTVAIDGATNVTSALGWSALDTLELFVAAGGGVPTEVQWRVNGVATQVATITAGGPLGTLGGNVPIDLLCNGTARQFSAYVQRIGALRSGARPAWADGGRVADFDFRGAVPGAASLAGYGLGFARASAATVQTGASTVVTSGLGADVPRVGSDGVHGGLVLEEPRTNLVTASRDMVGGSGWTASSFSTDTANYVEGPDGTVTADRAVTQFNGYGPSNVLLGAITGGTTYTCSQWVRTPSDPGPAQGAFALYTNAEIPMATAVATTSWQRLAATAQASGSGNGSVTPIDGHDLSSAGGQPAGVYDNVVDLVQLEAGAFATEAIVTSNTSATRAGERLWHPRGASLVDNGRLSLELALQPKGGRAQYAAPVRLWSVDASNYAEINPATGVITVAINGATNVTSALDWSALDTLELFVAAGGGVPTEVRWRVNGASTKAATVTAGAPLSEPTVSGALELLCAGTARQFTAYVRRVSAWRRGQRPDWAQTA